MPSTSPSAGRQRPPPLAGHSPLYHFTSPAQVHHPSHLAEQIDEGHCIQHTTGENFVPAVDAAVAIAAAGPAFRNIRSRPTLFVRDRGPRPSPNRSRQMLPGAFFVRRSGEHAGQGAALDLDILALFYANTSATIQKNSAAPPRLLVLGFSYALPNNTCYCSPIPPSTATLSLSFLELRTPTLL